MAEESIDQAADARQQRLDALQTVQLSATPNDQPNSKEVEENVPEGEPMEQASMTRRERLKALREAKELLSAPEGDSALAKSENSEHMEENEGLNMRFRNYLPHDKELQEGKLAPAVLPKFEDPVADLPKMPEKIEDPFLNIAPKKPNWDLRRDVQKRLEKLERRTQKAIYQITQELEKEREAEGMELENGD